MLLLLQTGRRVEGVVPRRHLPQHPAQVPQVRRRDVGRGRRMARLRAAHRSLQRRAGACVCAAVILRAGYSYLLVVSLQQGSLRPYPQLRSSDDLLTFKRKLFEEAVTSHNTTTTQTTSLASNRQKNCIAG